MNEAGFVVVRAGVEHLESLTPLFDAYRQFYEQPADPRAAEQFLRARFDRSEAVVFLAQDPGGTALGFTQLYPIFSSVRLKPMWILNDLYVAPSGRRLGIARALMARAKQHAIEHGAGGLELQTGKENTGAQALYRDEGWQLEKDYFRFFLDLD